MHDIVASKQQHLYDAQVTDLACFASSRNVSMLAGLKPTLASAVSFSHTDFRPDLKSFDVPTLVLHGTADKTVPINASGRAAAAGIKNSLLIEYDGAPHGLFATHKERFTKDLLTFFVD